MDDVSYTQAKDSCEKLQAWTCENQRILRQGEILDVPLGTSDFSGNGTHGTPRHSHPRTAQYRVVLTEPVLQGYATENTEYTVVPPNHTLEYAKLHAASSLTVRERPLITYDMSEDFLAASLLDGPSDRPSVRVEVLQDGHEHSPLSMPIQASKINASMSSNEFSKLVKGKVVTPVLSEISPPDETLQPKPSLEEDDVLRIFASGFNLGRLGVFSGDWVRGPES